MDDLPNPAKMVDCPWCTAQAAGHFCMKCNGPVTAFGKTLFSANLVLKLLAVPASLLFISYELSNQQQTALQSREDQQKLVAAHGEFAGQVADLDAAAAKITLLGLNRTDIPTKDVTAALLEMNRAFNAIGAKLTPFEVVESPTGEPASSLQATWERCFNSSYYAPEQDEAKRGAYWSRLTNLLAKCQDGKDGSCPNDTVHEMSTVLSTIKHAPCHEMNGVADRDFGWIWQHLSVEIACQRTMNVSACLAEWDARTRPKATARN